MYSQEYCEQHRGHKVMYVSSQLDPLCARCKEELGIVDVYLVSALAKKEVEETAELDRKIRGLSLHPDVLDSPERFQGHLKRLKQDRDFLAALASCVTARILGDVEKIIECHKGMLAGWEKEQSKKSLVKIVGKHLSSVNEEYAGRSYLKVVHSVQSRTHIEHQYNELKNKLLFFEAVITSQPTSLQQLGIGLSDYNAIISDALIKRMAPPFNSYNAGPSHAPSRGLNTTFTNCSFPPAVATSAALKTERSNQSHKQTQIQIVRPIPIASSIPVSLPAPIPLRPLTTVSAPSPPSDSHSAPPLCALSASTVPASATTFASPLGVSVPIVPASISGAPSVNPNPNPRHPLKQASPLYPLSTLSQDPASCPPGSLCANITSTQIHGLATELSQTQSQPRSQNMQERQDRQEKQGEEDKQDRAIRPEIQDGSDRQAIQDKPNRQEGEPEPQQRNETSLPKVSIVNTKVQINLHSVHAVDANKIPSPGKRTDTELASSCEESKLEVPQHNQPLAGEKGFKGEVRIACDNKRKKLEEDSKDGHGGTFLSSATNTIRISIERDKGKGITGELSGTDVRAIANLIPAAATTPAEGKLREEGLGKEDSSTQTRKEIVEREPLAIPEAKLNTDKQAGNINKDNALKALIPTNGYEETKDHAQKQKQPLQALEGPTQQALEEGDTKRSEQEVSHSDDKHKGSEQNRSFDSAQRVKDEVAFRQEATKDSRLELSREQRIQETELKRRDEVKLQTQDTSYTPAAELNKGPNPTPNRIAYPLPNLTAPSMANPSSTLTLIENQHLQSTAKPDEPSSSGEKNWQMWRITNETTGRQRQGLVFAGVKSRETMRADVATARYLTGVLNAEEENDRRVERMLEHLRSREKSLRVLEFRCANLANPSNEQVLSAVLRHLDSVSKLKFALLTINPSSFNTLLQSIGHVGIQKLSFQSMNFQDLPSLTNVFCKGGHMMLQPGPMAACNRINGLRGISFISCAMPTMPKSRGDDIAGLLQHGLELRKAKFVECGICDGDLGPVRDILARNPPLVRLDFSYNEISLNGLETLLECCQTNTVLTHLVLRGSSATFGQVNDRLQLSISERPTQLNLYVD